MPCGRLEASILGSGGHDSYDARLSKLMNSFGRTQDLQNLKAKAAENSASKSTPGDAHADVNDDEGCDGLHSLLHMAWYASPFSLKQNKRKREWEDTTCAVHTVLTSLKCEVLHWSWHLHQFSRSEEAGPLY